LFDAKALFGPDNLITVHTRSEVLQLCGELADLSTNVESFTLTVSTRGF